MNISHDDEPALPREAADLPAAFATAFNTGQIDTVDRLYEPDALFVPPGGEPVTGERRRDANAQFLRLGLPISIRPRHVHVRGDIALLIVDWTIAGMAADGNRTRVDGTATDVARRGADGRWRYVIDNPFGIADR